MSGSGANGEGRRTRRTPSSGPPPAKRARVTRSQKAAEEAREVLSYLVNRRMTILRSKYEETCLEFYFLQNMGSLLDLPACKKNPTQAAKDFVSNSLAQLEAQQPLQVQLEPAVVVKQEECVQADMKACRSSTEDAVVDVVSNDVVQPPEVIKVEVVPTIVAATPAADTKVGVVNSPSLETPPPVAISVNTSSSSLPSTSSCTSAVGDSIAPSQEAIVERAKQEAQVMARISGLRREGLWSARRLPKVQEPSRGKAHWDYLLEEMQWLAADFTQERKWKKAGAKKIASMISKYHKEKQLSLQKAEKEEGLRLKRIAGFLAKMVRDFWSNIEKVVEYKQQSRLEEKRKKALDIHLSFIVDQTEKYSSWLTAGLTPVDPAEGSPNVSGSDDQEFEPDGSSTDDEATIAAEEATQTLDDFSQELVDLQQDLDTPIEALLKSLPPEVLQHPASPPPSDAERSSGSSNFDSEAEGSDDDEETLDIEEENDNVDTQEELKDLQDESELTVEQLRDKYAAAYSDDFERNLPKDVDDDDKDTDSESIEEDQLASDASDGDEVEDTEEVGMEYLMTDLDRAEPREGSLSPGTDITDIAAAAQSIQPTGYTLQTTQVNTPVPFLIRHEMREYQVVGLNWLATMYERKLNGILADEMGLGKTIQAISLLAHLACAKSVWGPHLIVVPTSVMLNWELEFKKWCPAFKILTYFGTLKERKAKRAGWTKTNAFHVCITSYKLVIQDHQAFRRKKWKYLILDEAQNIKNFKSQRWQTLLNFSAQRRLLLTGTPLQNSLMELWSLMHFLMPHIFQSHSQFKEWFANPLTGMIEGSTEYNENLVKRLHKVLRPFLLRRLKADVEKQMPQKYEHVVRCPLSRRQRYLYDDFMAQRKTKETLASGHFMSVINILMQLRKVCNHPNLFDPRPIASPLHVDGLVYQIPSLVKQHHIEEVRWQYPCLAELESDLSSFVCQRVRRLQTSTKLIEEIDSQPAPPPRPTPLDKPVRISAPQATNRSASPFLPSSPVRPSLLSVSATGAAESTFVNTATSTVVSSTPSSQPITVQIQHTQQGTRLMIPSGQLCQLPGYIQIVQTSDGQQIIATCQPQSTSSAPISSTSAVSTVRLVSTILPTTAVAGRPVMRVTPTTTASQVASRRVVSTPVVKSKGPFHLDWLADRRVEWRRSTLDRIAAVNQTRCNIEPVYGCDVIALVQQLVGESNHRASWTGYNHCLRAQGQGGSYWRDTTVLRSLVKTPEDWLNDLGDVLNRYIFAIPPVVAGPITERCFHPPPSLLQQKKHRDISLSNYLSFKITPGLHRIITSMHVQFPDVRLIQYDCGKLQTLDILLRRLKSGSHRVLIFTQMTKMLDVLEQFLNFHGHRYLRLDGTTKVEQRQALMDRFNADTRIFVFILSTRSGGVGVNLTGADTVVFYDSDWNPTMDAQAQDRCHRIGQTRDVHIYRLISELTIEENILKKANQKRLLSDVTIEGGNFTTAFFKERTLHELFEEPQGLEQVIAENDRQLELRAQELRARAQQDAAALSEDQIEAALETAEDEDDVKAVETVRNEQRHELDEFNEDIPWDEREAELKEQRDEKTSRVEKELALLDKELTAIERYAVARVESDIAPLAAEELEKAEEEVVLAKESWELNRLKALKEEEELEAELEEDEMLFTYGRWEHHNKMFVWSETGEQLPMWTPPTPPQDDNDAYVDQSIAFLYEPSTMPETQLPAIFSRRDAKRLRLDPALAGRKRVLKDDLPRVPRSLFDRSGAILRRVAEARVKPGLSQKTGVTAPATKQGEVLVEHPEWLVQEDWTLLQAIQSLLELPLNLVTSSPGHTPNWELVADIVNMCSRTYRSARYCRMRFENVLVPREEGRTIYDMTPRKQKKAAKAIYKTKNRPMRTSQVYSQDNHNQLTSLFIMRFDHVKLISSKRQPTVRPSLSGQSLKNPKHAAVLAEHNINYDAPLTPIQCAQARAERVAKEKKEQQQQAAAQKQQQTQQQVPTVTGSAVLVTSSQQLAVVSLATQPATQTTTLALPGLSLHKPAGVSVSAVSLTRGLAPGSSIVVSTPFTSATIGRKLAQPMSASLTAQAVRVARAITPAGPTAMPTQLLSAKPAQTPTSGSTVTVAQFSSARQLTPQQFQMLQRKALMQQQQQKAAQQAAAAARLPGQMNMSGVKVGPLPAIATVAQQRAVKPTSLTQQGPRVSRPDEVAVLLKRPPSASGTVQATLVRGAANVTIPVSGLQTLNKGLPQPKAVNPQQIRQLQLQKHQQRLAAGASVAAGAQGRVGTIRPVQQAPLIIQQQPQQITRVLQQIRGSAGTSQPFTARLAVPSGTSVIATGQGRVPISASVAQQIRTAVAAGSMRPLQSVTQTQIAHTVSVQNARPLLTGAQQAVQQIVQQASAQARAIIPPVVPVDKGIRTLGQPRPHK